VKGLVNYENNDGAAQTATELGESCNAGRRSVACHECVYARLVGYAGNKMYYAQNLQTQMIVAQRIDTALHVGTHFDGAMHATDNRKGDMASLPLDYLVNRGVVVDISRHMHDWAVITPEMIETSGPDIREGDIVILHTGYIPAGTAIMRASRSRI
jgi:putative cyclase